MVPPDRQQKTVAQLQYELLAARPYHYTSDDLLFLVHALRTGVAEEDQASERAAFFAKAQACLRASPLAKTYGWGLHFDEQGRVALYPRGSADYQRWHADPTLTHLKAMRSRR